MKQPQQRRKQRAPVPSPTSQQRTALFVRICAGETRLFAALSQSLSGLLCSRLRSHPKTWSLSRQEHELEDVLQETYLRLWRHLARFDPSRGNIDAWAWTIARNLAVGLLRRHPRGRPILPLATEPADDRAAQPDERLVAEDARQVFAQVLRQVANVQERQVLELRFVEGLPYATISQVTGVPLGTVATWVRRLRRTLSSQGLRAA